MATVWSYYPPGPACGPRHDITNLLGVFSQHNVSLAGHVWKIKGTLLFTSLWYPAIFIFILFKNRHGNIRKHPVWWKAVNCVTFIIIVSMPMEYKVIMVMIRVCDYVLTLDTTKQNQIRYATFIYQHVLELLTHKWLVMFSILLVSCYSKQWMTSNILVEYKYE